ncbi:MAG: SUF system Fe-S cluster assembly regulator [Legionellales bacterium]|nr:SUF system Fe-S cluster assembly regulator [Legionellales bacterium]
MLKVGKLTDYATVILTVMARAPEIAFSANDLAQKTHISLPTVSKILKQLTRAQLLLSERGAKGGYRLAATPNQISLVDIINAMEQNTAMIECGDHHSNCQIEPFCSIKGNWRLISLAVQKALADVSLASLIAPLVEFQVNLPRQKTIPIYPKS